MHTISVLMTVYDESIEWVKKAIESTRSNTVEIEYVIVIDNPKYNELVQLKKFIEETELNAILELNTVNVGLVESLNKAFLLSTGDYLARMDADDFSFEHRLIKQLAFIEKENLDFVASQVEFMDQHEQYLYSLQKQTDLVNEKVSGLEKRINQFWHPTWLMKRQVMVALKGYRDVPYAEDYDFVARAILAGYKLGLSGEALLKKRVDAKAISSRHAWQQRINAGRIKRSLKRNQTVPLGSFKAASALDSEVYSKLKEEFKLRKTLNIPSLVGFMFKLVGTRPGRALLHDVSVEKILEKIWI